MKCSLSFFAFLWFLTDCICCQIETKLQCYNFCPWYICLNIFNMAGDNVSGFFFMGDFFVTRVKVVMWEWIGKIIYSPSELAGCDYFLLLLVCKALNLCFVSWKFLLLFVFISLQYIFWGVFLWMPFCLQWAEIQPADCAALPFVILSTLLSIMKLQRIGSLHYLR